MICSRVSRGLIHQITFIFRNSILQAWPWISGLPVTSPNLLRNRKTCMILISEIAGFEERVRLRHYRNENGHWSSGEESTLNLLQYLLELAFLPWKRCINKSGSNYSVACLSHSLGFVIHLARKRGDLLSHVGGQWCTSNRLCSSLSQFPWAQRSNLTPRHAQGHHQTSQKKGKSSFSLSTDYLRKNETL